MCLHGCLRDEFITLGDDLLRCRAARNPRYRPIIPERGLCPGSSATRTDVSNLTEHGPGPRRRDVVRYVILVKWATRLCLSQLRFVGQGILARFNRANKFGGGFVVRVLEDKFAADGEVEDGLTEVVRRNGIGRVKQDVEILRGRSLREAIEGRAGELSVSRLAFLL